MFLGGVDDGIAEAIAACPHLTQLRWLMFSSGELTFAGVRAIAASALLDNLRAFGPGSRSADPRLEFGYDWTGGAVDAQMPTSGKVLKLWYGDIAWLECMDSESHNSLSNRLLY
jgi:hypothetical protein